MTDPTLLYWGLGLLAASLLLIVVELFVPSGGIISIGAGICAIAAVVVLFRHDTTWGLIGLLAVMVLGPMAFAFAIKVYPSTPIGRRMLFGESGEDAATEQVDRVAKERERVHALLHAEGFALTDLRPVGTIEIDGARHDALAEGGMIEAGTKIRVSRISDGQIKVRATV